MLSSLSIACVISLLAPFLPLAPQAEDVARLLPADAGVILRLHSARAWNELVHAFAPLAGEEASGYDLQATLDEMATHEARQSPELLPRLDPELPLYLAFSFEPGGRPALTFVAPVTNDQPWRLHSTFTSEQDTCARLGAYSGVSLLPGYGVSAVPNPHVASLREGLVSAHVDLGALIALFRPLIEMGLGQAEAMVDQVPSEATPFDLQPLMEAYIEAARAILDGAESLDLALERQGESLGFRVDYVERKDRELRLSVGDVSELLGMIDPASSIQMAYNGTWTEYLEAYEEFVDAALSIYPEPLRADMSRTLAMQKELGAFLAPGMVAGVDFGSEGLHGSYVLRSSAPRELVDRLEALIRTFDHEGGFLRLGSNEPMVIAGLEARMFSLQIRYEGLVRMFQGISAENDPISPEGEQEMLHVMESLYGRNLRLALGYREGLVVMAFGSNDSLLRTDLERLGAPASPSPKLLSLVDRIEPGALGGAYSIDLGQAMAQMFEAMRSLFPVPAFFPRGETSMGFWGSMQGRSWSGGMSMSLAEILEFGRQVKALVEPANR